MSQSTSPMCPLPWPPGQPPTLGRQPPPPTPWIARNQFGAAGALGTGIHRLPAVLPRKRASPADTGAPWTAPAKRPRAGVPGSTARPWLLTPVLFQVLGTSALTRSNRADRPETGPGEKRSTRPAESRERRVPSAGLGADGHVMESREVANSPEVQ